MDECLGPKVGERAQPGQAVAHILAPLANQVPSRIIQPEPGGDYDSEEEDRKRLHNIVLGQDHQETKEDRLSDHCEQKHWVAKQLPEGSLRHERELAPAGVTLQASSQFCN